MDEEVYIHAMKITILGSGTSHGVPMIGCRCAVCLSGDKRNQRTRSSIWVRAKGRSIVIDTATDFRTQALREGIDRLDAVLYTHPHADHLHGLDDTRSLTHDNPVPLYATRETAGEIRNRFDYIFRGSQHGGGKPRVYFREITEEPFEVGPVRIVPVPILHGDMPILGYRFGSFAYLTDCSGIDEEGLERLEGVRTLVIGALRDRPHPTHFTVEQAMEAAKQIGARRTVLTHMCHDLEHRELNERLPDGFEPAYDGLSLEIEDSD